ncbi:MAG TPA: VWA domain-containing protein [Blastocatellia bacterium]|jgi:Mg-chelatase subunit ChlD|nr:VWA domain-containing protein [Blastocatellia bacterium]
MLSIISLGAMIFVFGAIAQTRKPQSDQKKNPSQTETEKTDEQEVPIKVDTDVVTVPVIASDRADVYVPDLTKDEFTVYEDGLKQEIEFFAAVRTPFTVVLMLDTSASTQEKLPRIQRAAKAFLEQLQPADRIKIISFDDGVHDLSQFTNDRGELNMAIDSVKPGQGTKIYDAVKYSLNDLARLKGRKAIVIFTDGVDWTSDLTDYDDNIRQLEESSVIVYPIRYDTRHETEALIRRQQERGETVDLGAILGPGGPGNRVPPVTTPPTVPGGQRTPSPSGRGGQPDTIQLPIPPIVIERGRYPDRYPQDRYPQDRGGARYPDDRFPPDRYPDDRFPDSRNPPRRRGNDNVSVMLDTLYRTADQYLQDMARRSGGEVHRADTLGSLPDAFANIAAELRNQYSLGYYPTNQARDGKYRKIQVKVSRKDVVVRARPGYRAPGGTSKAGEGKNFVSSREW